MNITTLPISYRPNRPFRILFTPFVASCIFRLCGGTNQIFPINLRSLRDGGVSTDEEVHQLSSYATELSTMGIGTEHTILFSDVSNEFNAFLVESIKREIRNGTCQYLDQRVSYCTCGKVEIPSEALQDIYVGSRSQIVRNNYGVWTCRFCRSTLQEGTETTLIHQLYPCDGIIITPPKLLAKIRTEMSSHCRNPLMISRTHRTQSNAIRIGHYLIDPDYCWIHYLDFLFQTKSLNDFILIVGVNQLAHASRLIMFTRALNPQIQIRLVVTPLIDLNDMSKSINRKTTLARLGITLGSTTLIRPFLSTLIRWNREISRIDFGDIDMLQKTSFEATETADTQHLTLQEMTERLDRPHITRMLRTVRQHKVLTIEEQQLFNTIV